MNGLGLPKPSPSIAQLRADLAMAEACEPIWQAHQDAKAAHADAVESGDLAAIRETSRAKNDAAVRLNDTREWLRRERRITKLTAEVPALEARLAGPILDTAGREDAELRAELVAQLADLRQELPELESKAAPLRELFGSVPAAPIGVVVEDGSTSADGLPAMAQARVRTGKTGGK
ncbi:hypothetical protein AB0J63_17630 [Streptosporangium canum]|uniref:hypothetical protein n=1 Tax=Streptosporangium canum TaxID=324952 RepID=UPI003416919D